jgi:tetratricopeptide (TPR) repeat protein
MSKCIDKRFNRVLYAYELDMLDEKSREELEIHLLECPYCNNEVRLMKKAAHLLRDDLDLREQIFKLAESREDVEEISYHTKASHISVKKIWQTYVPALAAIAAILFILLVKPWQIEIRPSLEAYSAKNSIVVMHFDNLVKKNDSDHIGEIAANLLITDLSESQYVNVVSIERLNDVLKRLGINKTKSISDDIALQAAVETGANWLIRGSILQIDPQIIITTRMIDLLSGQIQASTKIKGEKGEDIFSVVDRLTAKIKNGLVFPKTAKREPDRHVADITTHSSVAYQHYLKGVEYDSKLYFQEARESFKSAVEADSTFAMAYYYLSLYSSSPKHKEYISKAVKYSANASKKDRFYIYSRDAVLKGDSRRAIGELEKLIKQYPYEKRAYLSLGRYTQSQGQFGKAIVYLNRAIEIDPWFKEAYNQLAYLYNQIGSHEESIRSLNRYMELVPEEANPYDTKGDILLRSGSVDSAIASYEKAIKIKPDFYVSLRSLARIYTFLKEYDKAEKYINMLAESDDINFRTMGKLGKANLSLYKGKFRDAIEALDNIIQNENKNRSEEDSLIVAYAYLLKSIVYAELYEYNSAIQDYHHHVDLHKKIYPDRVPRYPYSLVRLLIIDGEFEKAEQFADSLRIELRERGEQLYDYWHSLGLLALNIGDTSFAIENFVKASAGGSFFPSYMLGIVYLESGQYEEAIMTFNAIRNDYATWRNFGAIQTVKLHYYLGRAYEESRWYIRAIDEYNEFINLWKNADRDIKEIEDARKRRTKLKNRLKSIYGQ